MVLFTEEDRKLISIFAAGKMGRKLDLFIQTMDYFVTKMRAELERVNQDQSALGKTNFSKLRGSAVTDFIKTDLESAEISVQLYRRTERTLGNIIAMFSSNYSLGVFLKSEGISSERARIFEVELDKYWNATYGKIINMVKQMRVHLNIMIHAVEEEIIILNKLKSDNLELSVEHYGQLEVFFEQERDAFWHGILEDLSKSKQISTDCEAQMAAWAQKAIEAGKAYVRFSKAKMTQNISGAETSLKRATLILAYLILAAKTAAKIHKIALGKTISVTMSWARRKLAKKNQAMDRTLEAALGVAGISPDQALTAKAMELITGLVESLEEIS